MQTQMTERDKRLIVMLSLIVIIVGFGWWGIRPALKSTKTVKKEYNQQKDLQEVNELKLSQLPMYQVEAEKYDEMVAEEQKNFYSIMTSGEIDRLFTDMALSHHLNSYDLSISIGREPTEVRPYQYSALAAQVENAATELAAQQQADMDETQDKKDSTEAATEAATEEVEDPFAYVPSIAYNSEIYAVDISMRLSGERKDLQALIDELSNSEKKILVRNFVWSEEITMGQPKQAVVTTEENASADTEAEDAYTMHVTSVLNINLTLYMCDTSDPTEGMTETESESE